MLQAKSRMVQGITPYGTTEKGRGTRNFQEFLGNDQEFPGRKLLKLLHFFQTSWFLVTHRRKKIEI